MKISVGKIELILTKEDPNKNAGLPFLYYKTENNEELVELINYLKTDEAKVLRQIFVQVADEQKAVELLKKNLNS